MKTAILKAVDDDPNQFAFAMLTGSSRPVVSCRPDLGWTGRVGDDEAEHPENQTPAANTLVGYPKSGC